MSSRQELARRLELVDGFPHPAASLEQYMTSPEVAASLIHVADLRGDLHRPVIDLGTGTGILAIAAALRGAPTVIGVDIDHKALSIAVTNRERLSTPVHLVLGAVDSLPVCPDDPVTVLMNPPFGAHLAHRGADRPFLLAASRLATVSYSIHNEGSRSFVEAFAADNGGTITDAYAVELSLPAQFDHHDHSSVSVDGEAFRIEWQP